VAVLGVLIPSVRESGGAKKEGRRHITAGPGYLRPAETCRGGTQVSWLPRDGVRGNELRGRDVDETLESTPTVPISCEL
jgi:hypothetical protein